MGPEFHLVDDAATVEQWMQHITYKLVKEHPMRVV
jgi:hypothetical protein